MQTTNKTFTVLHPTTEGNYLTDGSAISTEVWLASNDTPDRWREITAAEAEEITRAQEEASNAVPSKQP